MFGKDVVELTLQYIPYEAYLFTTLSLISKQWNKLVETEEVWRKIFFKKYPMARGVLTHDFKRAYMEMLWYTKNNKKEFEKKELKLVLLGSKRSGKTSLVQHFASTQFYGYLNAYYPTTKQIVLNNRVAVTLYILDSASTSDEAEMPNSDGFLVLCSIVDKQSLRHAEDIIVQTYRNLKETCGRIPIILVATKSDLHEGRYDFREVQRLAEKYYISHCYLTSASSGLNIQNAFVKLAEIVGYSYDEEFEKLENGESIIKLVENKKCNIT